MAIPERNASPSPLEMAESAFAHHVAAIGAVKRVIAAKAPQGKTLWTIMSDQEGKRETRRSIHEAEMEVMGEFPDAEIEFRLINEAELADPAAVHMPQGNIVYERQAG